MKSLEDYIQEAAKGGSTRSGIVLGIRMSLLALKELQLETPPHDRSLITIVEIDRCLPDAVQLLTGCRLGNRTLKFKDYGKMAATFVDMEKNRAIRIAAKESVNQRLLASNPADEEEALRGGYQSLPDEDLFTWQWVRIALPVEEEHVAGRLGLLPEIDDPHSTTLASTLGGPAYLAQAPRSRNHGVLLGPQ